MSNHPAPVTKNQLMRAIKKLMIAYEAHSWRGAGDPEDIPNIELKLDKATIQVNDLIRRLPIGD